MHDLREIAQVLKGIKSALIFTHSRPDGDALGSALALFYALQKLNIRCEICNDCDVPEKYFFLDGMKEVVKTPSLDVDAYIAVDSSDETRLGTFANVFLQGKRKKITVNIDHHVSNTRFAQYNFVRTCAANCQNIAELIALLGVSMDKNIADALMLGLLTDSGAFSHSDVDGQTFRIAATLADAGADVNTVNYHAFKKQSKARAALYGHTMSAIRYLLDDRMAVIVITKAMLEQFGADQSVTEGFVDFPLSVEGVEVALAILEVKPHQYKISLRSKGKANVNQIAATYGGGGHVLASGCMMFGDLEEIIDKLRYTVSTHLD